MECEGIMVSEKIDKCEITADSGFNRSSGQKKGYTLIETLIALIILGLLSAILYPNIINSLEKRALENATRGVVSTLQRAKFQAVKTKMNHRVRFSNDTGAWIYSIEKEDTPGVWTRIVGHVPKTISTKMNVTVTLPDPDLDVVFSPLGIVSNSDPLNNSIIFQSDRLRHYNQPDQREIRVFVGGSVQYLKSESQ